MKKQATLTTSPSKTKRSRTRKTAIQAEPTAPVSTEPETGAAEPTGTPDDTYLATLTTDLHAMAGDVPPPPPFETSTEAYVAKLHTTPAAAPEAPAPVTSTDTASDAFTARVKAIIALVAEGEAAVADAVRSGRIAIKMPRQARTTAPRTSTRHSKHLDLSDETKAAMLADRNGGLSYVQIDLKHGFEDAVATRGRVSWCVCRDARAAGTAVC